MAEQPEKKAISFIVSDESVNSYGSWVVTEGIDMTDFLKNPVMLWNHTRTWRGTTDEVLPIGRWENLRIEKGKLLADAVFDGADEFAQKIAAKVDGGFLKGASIGIRPVEYSEDTKLVKPGQRYATVTKSRLMEISIVDIPANKNAVALYDADGQILTLGDNGEGLPMPPLTAQKQSDDMDLKETAKALGLAETASQADINAAIARQNALLQTLNDRAEEARKTQRNELIGMALSDGRLHTDAQRPVWEKLFDTDFETAKTALEALPKVQKLADFPKGQTTEPGGTAQHKGMTFSELSKKEPAELARLQKADPATFKSLYLSEYGVDWKG